MLHVTNKLTGYIQFLNFVLSNERGENVSKRKS